MGAYPKRFQQSSLKAKTLYAPFGERKRKHSEKIRNRKQDEKGNKLTGGQIKSVKKKEKDRETEEA